jgi:hypothetical protein
MSDGYFQLMGCLECKICLGVVQVKMLVSISHIVLLEN